MKCSHWRILIFLFSLSVLICVFWLVSFLCSHLSALICVSSLMRSHLYILISAFSFLCSHFSVLIWLSSLKRSQLSILDYKFSFMHVHYFMRFKLCILICEFHFWVVIRVVLYTFSIEHSHLCILIAYTHLCVLTYLFSVSSCPCQ